MTAQYVQLDGRRFINSDFLAEVRKLYPATTKKIPLGFSTYVGWTGADLVLFTQHDPVGGLEGVVYEVTTSPIRPSAFDDKILRNVKHRVLRVAAAPVVPPPALELEPEPPTRTARAAQGLYGYAKTIQASCEVASRRVSNHAAKLMRQAVQRDAAVIPFLQHHLRKGRSLSARVLLGAYRDSLPKIAAETVTAASPRIGLYGFPLKTAATGLQLCANLRETAGIVAADLHRKRAALHPTITGFLDAHSKTAKCGASRLLLSCYPDANFKFRRRLATPTNVDEWLRLPSEHLTE